MEQAAAEGDAEVVTTLKNLKNAHATRLAAPQHCPHPGTAAAARAAQQVINTTS